MLMGVLLLVLVVVFAALLIVYPTVRAIERRLAQRPPRPAAAAARGAFPVVGVHAVVPLENDGPGRYLIIGVVAATQTDIRTHIEAETLANAQVKAELRGIVVTDIVKQ